MPQLLLLAATACLTMLGLGVLFPVGPLYTRALGITESEWGFLMAIFPLMGVATGWLWGRFSQRRGRKPAIMIGLVGFGAGSLLFALGDTYNELILARFVGGTFAAATIPAIFASVADVTTAEKRSVGMGIVGAAIGLGLILGPVFCAILTPDDAGLAELRRPYWISAGLAALNLLLVWWRLPETWNAAAREAAPSRERTGIVAGWQRYWPFLIFSLLVQTGFMGLESTLTFLVADRFEGGPRKAGLLLGVVGLVAVFVQGGLIRPLSKRYSDYSIMIAGTVLLALGLGLVGLDMGWNGLVGAGAVLAAGHALATPTFIALLSRTTTNQGEAHGLNHSAQSWGRVIGPLLMTKLYQDYGPELSYGIAGGLGAVALFLALAWLGPRRRVADATS